MKNISNTTKHLTGGFIAGFISMLIAINIHSIHYCWLSIILWLAGTCGFEYWQYLNHGEKRNYWEIRGIDTICDLLAGNLPFMLMTIVGTYGQSVVGVMR